MHIAESIDPIEQEKWFLKKIEANFFTVLRNYVCLMCVFKMLPFDPNFFLFKCVQDRVG